MLEHLSIWHLVIEIRNLYVEVKQGHRLPKFRLSSRVFAFISMLLRSLPRNVKCTFLKTSAKTLTVIFCNNLDMIKSFVCDATTNGENSKKVRDE